MSNNVKMVLIGLIVAVLAFRILTSSGSDAIITQDVAYANLQEDDSIILIDVRSQSEYNEGHIENSVLIPLGDIEATIESKYPDKDALIYLYCRSGNRAESALSILKGLGYTNAYNIGGVNTWEYGLQK